LEWGILTVDSEMAAQPQKNPIVALLQTLHAKIATVCNDLQTLQGGYVPRLQRCNDPTVSAPFQCLQTIEDHVRRVGCATGC
jgi:hypothetical protein